MYRKTLIFLASALTGLASPEALEGARDVVKEWATAEKAISLETAEWVEREQLLVDLLKVGTQRITRLEGELEGSAAGITAADEERAELLERQDLVAAKTEQIEAFLVEMESTLRDLRPRLPEPLVGDLASVYQRLPEAGGTSSLSIGERMRTVVSLLGRIRQFDDKLTITESIRELPGSKEEASVRTLYIGLGQAYYIAPDDAGYGVPGPTGWEWTSEPEIENEVREAIRIADGAVTEPKFIRLPLTGVAKTEVAQ